jgi:hypothetical protein
VERLGNSDAFGEVLLEILVRAGWVVERRRAFAGDGVLVIARHGDFEFKAAGPSIAAAARELFHEASRFFPRVGLNHQLRLFAA